VIVILQALNMLMIFPAALVVFALGLFALQFIVNYISISEH